MNLPNIIVWEDKLTRLALIFLVLASAYGIVVGATITMYYDITPNMGSLEDRLGSVQLVLYLLAVIISFSHLPLAISDVRHKLWTQAAIRAVVGISPLIVLLGTEGLIAHFLWWSPLSSTDRYHMLHHSLYAGAWLTLGYWLVLHWWWRPATFSTASLISLKTWVVSTIVMLIMFMIPVSVLAGLDPVLFGVTAIIGLVVLLLFWLMSG